MEQSVVTWPFFHTHRILVVWSDDTDRSFRVSVSQLQQRLEQDRAMVIVADVGRRWPVALAADVVALPEASLPSFPPFWLHVLQQMDAWTGRVYLLGYCTTSREGVHMVQAALGLMPPAVQAALGLMPPAGKTQFSYDAHAFGGACAPSDA